MDSSANPDHTEPRSRFGWGLRHSNNSRLNSQDPWASPWNSSRRQSLQNGSTTSFVPQAEINEEDEEDATPSQRRSVLPTPIGTKPAKSKASASNSSPRLNPTARDFTTMFGFGKKADKPDKAGSKAKKRGIEAGQDEADHNETYDSSPPDSRKSRDTQPNSFTDSFEDIAEEPDSSTLPDSVTTPGNRGSLMRRITSKGNTGKFLGIKTKKTAVQVEDGEEDSGSSKLGQSVESITNTPTTAATPDKRSSASSFFGSIGRRKKKVNEAPSLSEASLASETGDEAESRTSADGIAA